MSKEIKQHVQVKQVRINMFYFIHQKAREDCHEAMMGEDQANPAEE